jgi:hypothetical protein
VRRIWSAIPTSEQGKIEFSQLLNAAAGFKELQLDSVFGKVAEDMASKAKGKRIPIERSGGGT